MALLLNRGIPSQGGIGQVRTPVQGRTSAGILLGGALEGADAVAATTRPLPRLLQPRPVVQTDAESPQEKISMDRLHFMEYLL
jgi:hypothetical protein